MKQFWCILLLATSISACKSKKKFENDPQQFFPIISYIEGQVTQMDSSTATIMKIEKQDNNPPDTTYLRREEFKTNASDFLGLPEISSEKLRNHYEVTDMYDDLMKAYVFTYTTQDEDLPLKKQDVIVEPTADGNNEIKAVNFDIWTRKDDSIVQKSLLWESGKRFLIVTKVSGKGSEEKIKVTEVKWMNAPEGFFNQ